LDDLHMHLSDLIQVSEHEWEIPRAYRPDMRVPVRLFATEENLQQIIGDKSLEQAVNATTLPGVVGSVVVMPDVHQGYGFPIGGVAATQFPDGVISPGAIGYDINCGVRLLASTVHHDEALSTLGLLADRLHAYCPSGVGGAGAVRMSPRELNQVLQDGADWAHRAGYATESDVERTEDRGALQGADPDCVSARAKERGRLQLGSLGAGNHFLEVDVVDEVFDEQLAAIFGLHHRCLAIQIHCGSRGLGHQVCTDYVQQLQSAVHAYGIQLPDRELVCAPMNSRHGRAYLGAMRAAANFAFANRQILAHFARRAFDEALGSTAGGRGLFQIYDVAHNMGKIEDHILGGQSTRVCVHRKGATRAFGPGTPGLPMQFARSGHPVLVPGSMGTASWVLAGTANSGARSWGSCCHGAGRLWSRTRAKNEIRGDALRRELEARGIILRAGSLSGLAEEAPSAYKDVDAVVETVVAVGIAVRVARLRPLVVIKG
jgi:tRNA-splicing ligase RtcB (3'-phosphate/5'-hydroxy nucleic acid ligase)